MPVTLQLSGLKYKNSQGQFQNADCLKGDPGDTSFIAPDYDNLPFPISKGQLCIYEGNIYIARRNILTEEEWTADHWKQTTIEEELEKRYEKPDEGIPAEDIAEGVIPDITGKADMVSAAVNNNFAALDSNGNLKDSGHKHSDYASADIVTVSEQSPEEGGNQIWIRPSGENEYQIPTYAEFQELSQDAVRDVQIGGSSIVSNGTADIPAADNAGNYGVVKIENAYGIGVSYSNGKAHLIKANSSQIKTGTDQFHPITPTAQHESTFYGLAKAAGDTTQSSSSNEVGLYTDGAKSAIQNMLSIPGLDENGKVLSSQLPSYVDDVQEYASISAFPETGESGKIYVALDTSLTYRWSGSAYVEISPSIALGETSSTAYRGDRGKAAYDAAVVNPDATPTSNSNNLVKSGGVYTALANKADKADTVLDTTLSRGRKSGTTVGERSIAFGNNVTASGSTSVALGTTTEATGTVAYAEGAATKASGSTSHAEGWYTTASGSKSHAEGERTTASGSASHAEGYYASATNQGSHAEGYYASATGQGSHAEGNYTTSSGIFSHAEGGLTTASATYAHAEGISTQANGSASHAEGNQTIANANYSHVSGTYNIEDSHESWTEWSANTSYDVGDRVKVTTTENEETTIKGYICKESNSDAEFTSSKWDEDHRMNYAVIVGNGNSTTSSNAYALEWNGNGHFAGDLYVGANADSTGGTKVATIVDVPVESGSGRGSVQAKAYKSADGTITYTQTASGTASFAEGSKTTASGGASHAEGYNTIAGAIGAHAEGYTTTSNGTGAHAEGHTTTASGYGSHAEGRNTVASGNSAHAEGYLTVASQHQSHAEGLGTIAAGAASHVSGAYNIEDSYTSWPEWVAGTSYAVGDRVKVTTTNDGETTIHIYKCIRANSSTTLTSSDWKDEQDKSHYAEIVGNGTYDARSNARALDWDGNEYLAGDLYVCANSDSTGGTKVATVNDIPLQPGSGDGSATNKPVMFSGQLRSSTATGIGAYAYGNTAVASGDFSHAEGNSTTASGAASHAEGASNIASQVAAHAEGRLSSATGEGAHSEGRSTTASGNYSHSEGRSTKANGDYSHAEGYNTTATGMYAHAENGGTTALGTYSHAEGVASRAIGNGSHAEGHLTIANGMYSHTFGEYNIEDSFNNWDEWTANTSYSVGDKVKVTTINGSDTTVQGYVCKEANSDAEFTESKWDTDYAMNYVEIVGNGASDESRSNARALDWNGNERLAGNVYVNCNADSTGGTMLPTDIQINGISIVTNGVANVPIAINDGDYGLVKVGPLSRGIAVSTVDGFLCIAPATPAVIKFGGSNTEATYRAITTRYLPEAVFYGLARAAGDATQSASSNAVGIYTDAAKIAIKTMLGIQEGLEVVRLI